MTGTCADVVCTVNLCQTLAIFIVGAQIGNVLYTVNLGMMLAIFFVGTRSSSSVRGWTAWYVP